MRMPSGILRVHGAPWGAPCSEAQVEELCILRHLLAPLQLVATEHAVDAAKMEMGEAIEHCLVAAEGGLGVPDDVLEHLVHGVAAHRELGALGVVCGRVEVLDGEMEVAAFLYRNSRGVSHSGC